MKTILLVDDVELFLELERSHLDGRGHRIVTATSGEEALSRLEETAPDLMLLDLYMPGMDGDEVCRRVRAAPRWRRLPIIMVTAAGKEHEIRKCLEAGCDDYVTKPVNKKELVEKVQRLLGEIHRRTAERAPVAIQVKVSTGDQSFSSYARDLSRNGIYIRSTTPLAPDTLVDLQLNMADGKTLQVMGRVKRVEKGEDGGMGVYFILPDAASRHLLDNTIEHSRQAPPSDEPPALGRVRQLEKAKAGLERDNRRLAARVVELEEENHEFANRIVQIEEVNNNLSNLYIASSRLHSVLDRPQVLEIMKEIVINFIGAEKFAILTLDKHQEKLSCEAGEGFDCGEFPPVTPGTGELGRIFADKKIYFRNELPPEGTSEPSDPLVAIPLTIGDEVLGMLTIYALFIQKERLEDIDFQLFSMLAEHAATALFSATLYEETERKRATYKGFMDLLLK